MGKQNTKLTLAQFNTMDATARVQLYLNEPAQYRELVAEQTRETVARLEQATHALRQTPDQPTLITLGPINLPWAVLLWQAPEETRVCIEQASPAPHLSKPASYPPRAG